MNYVFIVLIVWVIVWSLIPSDKPKKKKARKTKEEIKYRRKPCFRSEDQYPVENWEVS